MVVLRRRLQAFYDYEEDDLREIVSAIVANRIIENTIRRRSVRVRNNRLKSGELIVSKYVAESITMIAGRFGHEGLSQLRTEPKKLQCEIGYIANTGQWCCVMLSGCINNQ